MRRAAIELGLGARAAVGSPTTRIRCLLTALGVGLGVCVLLIAASVPHAAAAREAREQAVAPRYAGAGGGLRMLVESTTFDGTTIVVNAVGWSGPPGHAPRPPGLSGMPRPGEMVVSPSVDALLRGPGGAQLRRRLDARVVGRIGPAGLSEPGQAVVYRGSAAWRLAGQPVVDGFGGPVQSSAVLPLITLLTIVVVVALLLPVAVFVATAARFGVEERDRRLAAMRLVGADLPATLRIAAGESLTAAALGLVLGAGGFFLVRSLVARVGVIGYAVFPADLWPSAGLAALVAVLVPVSAVVATLASIRRVAAEPLGLTRRAPPRRRRIAWRLAAPLAGFALLGSLVGATNPLVSAAGQVRAAAGVILVLLGVTALLPWIVETLVRRAPEGPLPWLLAVRRLRHEEGTTGRVIGAIGLAVAGAIALSVVFSAAQSDLRLRLSPGQARQAAVTLLAPTSGRARADADVLRRVRGVERVSVLPGVAPVGAVDPRPAGGGPLAHGDAQLMASVRLSAHDRAAALQRLEDRAATLDPLAQVSTLTSGDRETAALAQLHRALVAGALVVLGMIGASLLIATGEGLRERRAALAVLSAVGIRRATVAWALLWQTAIPVVGGMGLALGLGIALGAVLSLTVGLHPVYDWGGVGLTIAAGLIITAAVTGLALPVLGRALRPQELRAE